MKKITLLFMLVFSCGLVFGQVVLSEDFEAGLTLPTGWTNNDIAGGGDVWAIATGADAIGFNAGNGFNYSLAAMGGNYAVFDSDGYGDNGIAENAAFESPVFDCSALASVTLAFNHFFTSGEGAEGFVEVSTNGTSWTQVASYSGATQNNSTFGLESLDISAELAGVSTAQVRFRWVGDYAWGWALDKISVFQCTVSAPNAPVAAINPANSAIGVEIDFGTINSINPFEWTAAMTGDPADSFNISLGTTPSGDDIGTLNGFSNGGGINYTWASNTTYYWRIDAVNCAGTTNGPVWSFTTAACLELSAPAAVTTPVPADGATEVMLNSDGNSLIFNWAGSDPDANYVLNLGTTNPPTQSFDNFQRGNAITGLATSTTYYWSINPINCAGTTSGTVWSFTTSASLSIGENVFETFSVYPNPTSDILNIKSSHGIDNVTVYNLLGQDIATFNKSNIINNTVNLAELTDGLYLVRITSGNNSQIIRVTKK